MPEACTGGAGATCGEGWDIALIRVTQLCPDQRCVTPLDLSTDALDEGATLTLAGAGLDPGWARDPGGGWVARSEHGAALRLSTGVLRAVRSSQVSMVLLLFYTWHATW